MTANSTSIDPRPAFFTGQVGVNKGPFIEKVAQELEAMGDPTVGLSTGKMMYAEDPSIPDGEILKLTQTHLRALRRGVMQKVFARKDPRRLLLNTHAGFRWAHGLFCAHDRDQLEALNAGLYINVLENFHVVAARLAREHKLEHSLIDVLVAREAELIMTRMFADFVKPEPNNFFVVARGPKDRRANAVAKLIHDPSGFTIYPSFPMTHVVGNTEVETRINEFRDRLAKDFIVFDPADVDEKGILMDAHKARQKDSTAEFLEVEIDGKAHKFSIDELLGVERIVDSQICDRDFKLIEQSKAIVSLVPCMANGGPAISSGVERELHHAFTLGRKVFVVWLPKRDPSPFVTNHVTKWFRSEDELLAYLKSEGYLAKAA